MLIWEPIKDLPASYFCDGDSQLGPLLQVWNGLREELEQRGLLSKFNSELGRKWAIETGQIEGLYDLDRGVTHTLIERGLEVNLIPRLAGQKQPEQIAAILQNHAWTLEGLYDFIKTGRTLSKGYVNEVHAALLRSQETVQAVDQNGRYFEVEIGLGQYKSLPNNPTRPDGTVHWYCPPEHVPLEMERLITMHLDHEARGLPVEVRSAWLHHRFTQIHPYQDGNGRVARALTTLLLIKAGWFPIVVTREDRTRYLDALEAGDEGDLKPLITLFVDIQRGSLSEAASIAGVIGPATTIEEAIAGAKKALAGTQSLEPSVWLQAVAVAEELMEVASVRLKEVADALTSEITASRPDLTFKTSFDWSPGTSPFEPRWNYNEGLYDRELALMFLSSEKMKSVDFHAHAIGAKSVGLIELRAYFAAPPRAPEWVSDGNFQVNYAETIESAERRFRTWFEGCLLRGLTLWRQTLR